MQNTPPEKQRFSDIPTARNLTEPIYSRLSKEDFKYIEALAIKKDMTMSRVLRYIIGEFIKMNPEV